MRKPQSLRHPVQPLANDRISALIAERGALGYGAYWMIIEALYREPSMQVAHTEKQLRRMAAHTGIDLADFRMLLRELVEVYDLLAIVDGCLVSTITYRKPRTAATQPPAAPLPGSTHSTPALPAAPPPPATRADAAPGSAGSATTAQDHPAPTHSAEQLRACHRLTEYIRCEAPEVGLMYQPLTPAEAIEISETYDQDIIIATLSEMHHHPRLHLDFISAYYTFGLFASGRQYLKPSPSGPGQHHTRPPAIS